MPEKALQAIASKPYHEAMNEILSIQKAAMMIQSNNVKCKVIVHKSPVDEITLDYLSAYFTCRILPADKIIPVKHLVIESQSSKIYIGLKEDSHG